MVIFASIRFGDEFMAEHQLEIENPLMTLKEVMEYTKCSKELICAESRQGRLKFYDRGGRGDRRWYLSDVQVWIEYGHISNNG